MNRRAFLATVAGAIAAPAVVPVSVDLLIGKSPLTYGSWTGGVYYWHRDEWLACEQVQAELNAFLTMQREVLELAPEPRDNESPRGESG